MNNHTEGKGTVISGTHRMQDLIPAFESFLGYIAREKPEGFNASLASATEAQLQASAFNAVPGDARLDDEHDWWQSEDASFYCWETLADAIENVVPGGYYFGAREGDGSDFGVWDFGMMP